MPARVWLWDLAQGKQVSRLALPDGLVNHLACSADLRQVVAALDAGGHGEARVWQLDPLTEPLVIHHDAPVRWAAFDPASQRIVTAGEDRTARVWSAAKGQPLTPPMVHAGVVTHAEFSADGRFVLTASSDATTSLSPGAARVWDAATGLALAPPLAHRARVAHVAWTARFGTDDYRIATAGWDHAACVWDLAPEKRDADQLRELVEVLSGARLEQSGALVPLAPAALRERWAVCRKRWAGDFEPTREQVRGWHHEQARTAEHDQNSLAAAMHWGQMIAASPRRADLYTRRGIAHAGRQRWQEAVADLPRGMKPGTDGWPARARLGVARLNVGQVARAEEELSRAMTLGAPWQVRSQRAVAAAALQRWAVAADDCEAVVTAGGNDPQVWRLWVLMCERMGQSKRAAAIRKDLLKRVGPSAPVSLALHVALTCCLGALEPADARRVVELTLSSTKKHGNDTLARLILGAALHRAGRCRDAVEQYQVTANKALPLWPCLGYALLTKNAQLTLTTQETIGITSGKGTLRFRFDSLNKRYVGPMLVFLEICEESGPNGKRTRASNTLAAVVTFRYTERSDP